jgi:hypothetical protein
VLSKYSLFFFFFFWVETKNLTKNTEKRTGRKRFVDLFDLKGKKKLKKRGEVKR